jgi:asparagine synthase (glutamine-hydrolysing)
MCGIAGVLKFGLDNLDVETLIHRMQLALQHRGPDDRGIYISPNTQAALIHTRLAILDLSASGHQPMSSSNSRYWITFNGEIYNFEELRSQLEAKGETFSSKTDTEVILKLYQHYGKDCLQHLRGMFAFAIWDDAEKTCFMARDPMGIKPFYYWQNGSTLIFASEVRAILASGLPQVSLSAAGLYGYLTNGAVPEPYTLIQDIRCLEAGNYLQWQSGRLEQSCYWQIDFSPQEISLPEAIQKTRAALIDSVKHHFVSDVPVGMFLSGGIDSTAVVALARQTQSGELRTYAITFAEAAWNEGAIASQVAREFATTHTEYQISASLGSELLPQFLQTLDQPSIDGFNTFCVSQIAHQDGMKVVLSGLGGDELFGGYGTFQAIPNLVRQRAKVNCLEPLAAFIGAGLESLTYSPKLRRAGGFLQSSNSIESAYHSFRGIFSPQEALVLMRSYLPEIDLAQISNQFKSSMIAPPKFSTFEDEVSYLEMSRYMRNQLLRDSDVMSMQWGLELRVPLVDQTLWSEVAAIPSTLRMAKNKSLLTQAVPEVPSYVKNRPKQGFTFPFVKWFEQEWHSYVEDIKVPRNIPLSSELWYRRWSLVILQYWLKGILS